MLQNSEADNVSRGRVEKQIQSTKPTVGKDNDPGMRSLYKARKGPISARRPMVPVNLMPPSAKPTHNPPQCDTLLIKAGILHFLDQS